MRCKLKNILILLFSLTSVAYLRPSLAANSSMRCPIGPKAARAALRQSAAVFSGEVVEVRKGRNFTEAHFRVDRTWKGVESEQVSVLAADNTAESPHYRVGEKYLVFAEIRNGKLFTDNCSRTKKVEYARGDLQQLGEGRASAHLEVTGVPAPLDLTSASDRELQQHLGERVTMRGRFSLFGKIGPFIVVDARPIYLQSHGPFSWGEPYAGMEGRDVRVTGTLRFAKYPKPPNRALHVARASDHFYFEAETAKVELSER